MTKTNKPDPANPAMALWFTIDDHGAGSLIRNVKRHPGTMTLNQAPCSQQRCPLCLRELGEIRCSLSLSALASRQLWVSEGVDMALSLLSGHC
jgi:hypothetical protein